MKTIIIFEFMIKDLKLKGSELLIYALFYSFGQFYHECYMKPDKIANVLGLSRSQVFRAISSLVKKGYVLYTNNGYLTHNRDNYDGVARDNLNEMIRIAKTPWLD